MVTNRSIKVIGVIFYYFQLEFTFNIQVDVNSIIERHKISAMIDVIARLNEIIHEWVAEGLDCVPEVDWNRIRQLDFQETIRKRDALASGLPTMACLTCPNFDEDVSTACFVKSVPALTLTGSIKFYMERKYCERISQC